MGHHQRHHHEDLQMGAHLLGQRKEIKASAAVRWRRCRRQCIRRRWWRRRRQRRWWRQTQRQGELPKGHTHTAPNHAQLCGTNCRGFQHLFLCRIGQSRRRLCIQYALLGGLQLTGQRRAREAPEDERLAPYSRPEQRLLQQQQQLTKSRHHHYTTKFVFRFFLLATTYIGTHTRS